MKKKCLIGAIVTAIVMITVVVGVIMCVEKIPVGYEGVVYNINGGVSGETLSTGWSIVSPTKKVKNFTISNEQIILKSKVSEVTTDYSMMDIYSGNRSEINNKITEYLNNAFEKEYGIQVLDASIIDVHPDDKLKESIDNRVTALQQKQQAQVEQETAKVQAETALIKAQNEADIKVTAAKAEAEANQLKSASLTPELIQMTEAEARLKHGWVTVQGADATVVDANGK